VLSYQLSKAIKQVCQIARICYCSFPAFCFSSFAFFLSFSRFQFALLIVYFFAAWLYDYSFTVSTRVQVERVSHEQDESQKQGQQKPETANFHSKC